MSNLAPRRWIDLNADLGEECGDDEALLEVVTSANVATGAHAGGGAVLHATVRAAVERGIAVGAHPSYRDRAGFGRASLIARLHADLDHRAIFIADLAAQIGLVATAAREAGGELAHVKAHGALYNEAAVDQVAAAVVLAAVRRAADAAGHELALVTLPGGVLDRLARAEAWSVISEGFADRAYQPDGLLVPRTLPGSVHVEPAAMVRQAVDVAHGRCQTVDGSHIAMRVESLCVHGDTPGAVAAARAIRRALEDAGVTVSAPAPRSEPTAREGVTLRSRPMADVTATVRPFGDRAWLVLPRGLAQPSGTAPTARVLDLARRAARRWPQAQIVPGLDSVLIVRDVAWSGPSAGRPESVLQRDPDPLDDHDGRWPTSPAAVLEQLLGPSAVGSGADASVEEQTGREHRIAVRYDGPDLAATAALLALSAGELAARHQRTHWTVAAVGFSPGFGYLRSDDPVFADVPRRADPRAKVPAGSIAVAAGLCAVYPAATPGGWQLIGTTTAAVWAADRVPPALLRVGDLVRFEAVDD